MYIKIKSRFEKEWQTIAFFLIIVAITAFLYRNSFNAFFFQDDWFTFKISQVENITDIFRFFIPRTDIIYFRPLGMQFTFLIFNKLFGPNPFYFRIVAFTTHLINVFLVYKLVRITSKNKILALFSAYLYSISAIHYIPFYWSATYPFLLGPTMFFASVYHFIVFIKKKNNKNYLYSFLFFLVGIFINEIVLMMPLVLTIYLIFFSKLKSLKYLFFYLAILFLYFSFRFILYPPPSTGDYDLTVGTFLISSLKAYILWSFNWPEEMKAQFINFWRINPDFIRDFPKYYYVFLITFLVNVYSFIFPVFLYFLYAHNKAKKRLVFGFAWFIISLLPVIFFPKHAYAYYLAVPIIGLFLIYSTFLSYMQQKKRKRIFNLFNFIILVQVFNWTICAFYTIEFNKKVHWAPRRAEIAEKIISKRLSQITDEPRSKIYVFDTSENRLALNDQDAFQIIFENNNIETIFTKDKKKLNEE